MNKDYIVYFEIFGKRLKYKCKAPNAKEAKEQMKKFVADSINVVSIEVAPSAAPNPPEWFADAFLKGFRKS